MLRTRWRWEDGLTGKKVKSLDELQKILPETKAPGEYHEGVVYKNEENPIKGIEIYLRNSGVGKKGIEIYSRNSGVGKYSREEHVAYECNERCKGIIVGPPKIESFNTIAFLSGKKGVKYSCAKCNAGLYDHVIGYS